MSATELMSWVTPFIATAALWYSICNAVKVHRDNKERTDDRD